MLASSGKYTEDLIMDGIDPDALASDKVEAMDIADILLAAALDEVDWAAASYKPVKK